MDNTSGGDGQGRARASVSPCCAPRLTFVPLFQLSAVEAGGSTAFIYANFSVPVVKVRGEQGRGGTHAALWGRISCRESWLNPSRCPKNPDLNPPDHFGAPKPNPGARVSILGVPNPNLGASGFVLGAQNPNPIAPSLVLGRRNPNPRASNHFGALILNPGAPAGVLGGRDPTPGLLWGAKPGAVPPLCPAERSPLLVEPAEEWGRRRGHPARRLPRPGWGQVG